MATIASAPKEIQLNIFRNITSVSQIAQCRLVCKQWDAAAEMAMFGKKITLKTELQAINLYAHLCKDIRKGSMIRHLHFDLKGAELPLIYMALLNVALSSNIERLTGIVQTDNFFTALVDIAESKETKFSKLKELPTRTDGVHCLAAVKAMIYFKKTTTLVYSANYSEADTLDLMGELGNLTHLQLRGSFRSFEELDNVLSRCKHLKSLEIVDFNFCVLDAWGNRQLSISRLNSTYIVVKSLQSLKINFPSMRPDLLEYLQQKYPNMKSFEMNASELSTYEVVNRQEYMKRVLVCVSKIPSRNLTIQLSKSTNMFDALQLAQSSRLNVQYSIKKDQLVMRVT